MRQKHTTSVEKVVIENGATEHGILQLDFQVTQNLNDRQLTFASWSSRACSILEAHSSS